MKVPLHLSHDMELWFIPLVSPKKKRARSSKHKCNFIIIHSYISARKDRIQRQCSPHRQRQEGTFFYNSLKATVQCWGSVTFCCGSGSPDPYLCLMDADPDPTPFFSDFKDAKNIFFFFMFLFFSYNLPSGTLSLVL